jgi:hypothetical protein
MGENYQNWIIGEAERQPSRADDIARWEAMTDDHLGLEEAQNLQRERAADATRWTAIADYYQDHPQQSAHTALDECYDVSLSEVAACREASQ